MNLRRLVHAGLLFMADLLLHLLEAAAYFLTVALVAALLALVLPFAAALSVALVGVAIWCGYRKARRMERERMRGEL